MLVAYRVGTSAFHRIDPISKTIWCLIISTWMMGLRDPISAGSLSLVVLLFSWIMARLDLRRYAKVALVFLVGSLTLVVYQGVFRPGEGISIGFVHLSYEGLSIGAAIALRTFGIVASALAFAITTSPKDLATALVGMRMPYRIAHIVYLSLRFLPLVESDIESIREAQTTRGIKGGIGTYVSTVVALIATEYRRIDETAIALETRAFGLHETRTVLKPVTMTRWGITLVAITAASMIVHLIWLWLLH